MNPATVNGLSDEYYRRIEAIEFTVKSDDGKEPRNLPKADVVLIGVSRTSKTPLSIALAMCGIKAANQPIVRGIVLPEELARVDESRVVGLTIELDRLVAIRQARLAQLGMPKDASYGLAEQVRLELDESARIFAAHPEWPVIDVTRRAIEESAAMILQILASRAEPTIPIGAALSLL